MILWLAALSFRFVLLAPAGAGTTKFLERVGAANRNIARVSGKFEQRKRSAAFKQELVSHGRFEYARPARLEWRYTDPDPSVLVIDGQKATLTLPDEPPRSFDLASQPSLAAIARQIQ